MVVGSDEYTIGGIGMNGYRVDLKILVGGHRPAAAAVGGHPKARRGRRIERARFRRVLQDVAGPTRGGRDTLDLGPLFTPVERLIDAAACRSDDMVMVADVDRDRKHV